MSVPNLSFLGCLEVARFVRLARLARLARLVRLGLLGYDRLIRVREKLGPGWGIIRVREKLGLRYY